jgi:hypothetical protein
MKLCDNRQIPTPAPTPQELAKDTSFESPELTSSPSLVSSNHEPHQVTGGVLFSSSFQKISVLALASSSLSNMSGELQLSDAPLLCTEEHETNSSSRSQPTISFIFSLNGSFIMLPIALPLCQICEYCSSRSHPLVQDKVTALILFSSCPQTNSSLLSCSKSLRILLPILFDCCFNEFKEIPILFSPAGSFDIAPDASLVSWQYASDERIDQHWTAVEKMCREMESVPGRHQSLLFLTRACRSKTETEALCVHTEISLQSVLWFVAPFDCDFHLTSFLLRRRRAVLP